MFLNGLTLDFLAACGCFLLEGMIGGANERPSFHVFETHLLAKSFVFAEFVRMDESLNAKMLR